jgi:addiction module HigA family antidote
MTTIRAAEAFHPGEFLKEELDEREWSQMDFAAIIGQSPKAISDVINGRRVVSAPLAVAFSKALGSSAEYWLKLQTLFDLEQIANNAASDFCVPELDDFINRMAGYLARNKVAAFAQRVGVHPGLVVGQLHFREELPYSNLRKHLVKVRQYLSETTMTDGWGILPQLD